MQLSAEQQQVLETCMSPQDGIPVILTRRRWGKTYLASHILYLAEMFLGSLGWTIIYSSGSGSQNQEVAEYLSTVTKDCTVRFITHTNIRSALRGADHQKIFLVLDECQQMDRSQLIDLRGMGLGKAILFGSPVSSTDPVLELPSHHFNIYKYPRMIESWEA